LASEGQGQAPGTTWPLFTITLIDAEEPALPAAS
jgi:hypothetical protein